MANQSIIAAFERMWHHIVAALNNKSDVDHSHSEFCLKEDIDITLTQSGAAADAKAVGDQLSVLSQKIDNLDYESGITSVDDGSGNIILQALYIPLSSSYDNQGNVTITM